MAYPYNPGLQLDNDPDLDDEDLDLEDDDDDDASSSASSSAPLDDNDDDTSTRDKPPLPPAIPAIVLHKVVAQALVQAGFEEADADALAELEGTVASFFGSLLLYAHDLAEHARRHVPTVSDVLQGCVDLGVGGVPHLLQERDRASTATDSLTLPAGEETLLRLRYQRPRVTVDPGPLLASDDEPDPYDASNDPDLASPPATPPSHRQGAFESEDDEDDDFEEVTPVGPDGLPLPPDSDAMKQRREAVERKKRERLEKKERIAKDKEDRSKERERRRRERQRRREADPLKAAWLPTLPPKHTWKQTPVYPESAAPPPIPPPISQTQQAPSTAALQHLSTLRARLNDSQLVASSLRNLIRRTRASGLGAGAGTLGLIGVDQGAGGAGGGEADSADVVDYESEWYGARGGGGGGATGAKRKIRIVTVGTSRGPGDMLDLENEGGGEPGMSDGLRKGGGLPGTNASRVGGAVKRRRWLV